MKKYTLILLVSLLFVSSCSKQTLLLEGEDNIARKVGGVLKKEAWSDFFIGGIAQKDTINAKAICGQNNPVVKVEAEQTVVNWIVAFFTLSIYTPREYRVYCKR